MSKEGNFMSFQWDTEHRLDPLELCDSMGVFVSLSSTWLFHKYISLLSFAEKMIPNITFLCFVGYRSLFHPLTN